MDELCNRLTEVQTLAEHVREAHRQAQEERWQLEKDRIHLSKALELAIRDLLELSNYAGDYDREIERRRLLYLHMTGA